MFGGIPFEHFAHGGGGSFGGGRGGSAEPPDTTKLYETLELEKDATAKDIKKAYFRLSKIHHPDKGGDAHKFKEISAAYEILSDPEKRKQYDEYGLEGVDDEGGAAQRGEDLFSMFFGGGRGGGRARGPRKGPSVNHPIKVSLEDLYNGKTVKLAVNRKVIIGDAKQCEKCDGRGAIMEVRQIGPGMITQMQRTCPSCQGQGNTAKTKSERQVLEVHIEKGMKHEQKITFRGMADETPGMETGDVNFIIQEKEHELFKRKGADLLVTKDISLNQALTGFTWKIKHLDGRQVVIKTRPGQIIECETTDAESGRTLPYITMVKDEGMPSLGNPFVKGNLYIAFHVKFPQKLEPDVIKQLRNILPDADIEEEYDPEQVEEHFMDVADLRHFGKGGAVSQQSEYDSDDEDRQGGVQCQQS
ncbi:DnaJ homolog subfamily A member 2 [Fistulifera solaris]|uniref:DnaJ homolog subfamily A member 2 n=1 Tax=Fistulifera solaris TaxID=1519565 RepID=A0A1Z5JWB1_FISSO|nr:DnaJ homolog subfamily A member 2 [Fistulifera solaris]|eukprot:GAX18209.1 DnaJ homolog subfamily A member 2 [Fistulifera solaris]